MPNAVYGLSERLCSRQNPLKKQSTMIASAAYCEVLAEHIEHMRRSGFHYLLPIDENRCFDLQWEIQCYSERVRVARSATEENDTEEVVHSTPRCREVNGSLANKTITAKKKKKMEKMKNLKEKEGFEENNLPGPKACKTKPMTTTRTTAQETYLSSLLKRQQLQHRNIHSTVKQLLETLQYNESYNSGFESKPLRQKISTAIHRLSTHLIADKNATRTGCCHSGGGSGVSGRGNISGRGQSAVVLSAMMNPVDITYCAFEIECAKQLEENWRCVKAALKGCQKWHRHAQEPQQ